MHLRRLFKCQIIQVSSSVYATLYMRLSTPECMLLTMDSHEEDAIAGSNSSSGPRQDFSAEDDGTPIDPDVGSLICEKAHCARVADFLTVWVRI